jgi:hypothetical protein
MDIVELFVKNLTFMEKVTFKIPSKKIQAKYASLSKIFWCKKLTHGALQK